MNRLAVDLLENPSSSASLNFPFYYKTRSRTGRILCGNRLNLQARFAFPRQGEDSESKLIFLGFDLLGVEARNLLQVLPLGKAAVLLPVLNDRLGFFFGEAER